MGNWYTTRAAVKAALSIDSTGRDAVIDDAIESASREIDALCNLPPKGLFIPQAATLNYPWPAPDGRRVYVLPLDTPLLSVSALTKEGDDVTAIAAADFFLEPSTLGPPYWWIEIDQASSAFFGAKDTHQRAIRITGSWGQGNATKSASQLGAILSSTTATSIQLVAGNLLDVGNTILVETEQMFVRGKGDVDLGVNLTDALTADVTDTSLTIADPTDDLVVGEVVRVDSERMLVTAKNSATSYEIQRAYDGTTLASHTNTADIYAFRQFDVDRGVNGTTAATHADDTAINKYDPPADVQQLCRALALAYYTQGTGGWTGAVGAGEGATEIRGLALADLRKRVIAKHRITTIGAV